MRGYFNAPYLDDSTYRYPGLPSPTANAQTINQTEIDVTAFLSTSVTSWRFERAPSVAGPWSIIAIQASPIFANTGLSSGQTWFYRVSALLPSGYTTSYSPITSASIGSSSAIRFRPGMGAWFDNQFYYDYSNGGNPGNQRGAFSSMFPSIYNDTATGGSSLHIVEFYLTWSQIEGPTQGDYSRFNTFLNDMLPTVQAHSVNKKIHVIINMWGLRTFVSGTNTEAYFPQYALNNGWIIAIPAASGFTGYMGKWQDPNLVAAYTAAMRNVGSKINNNSIFEAFSVADESDMITDQTGTVTDAQWFSIYTNMHVNIRSAFPNMLIWMRGNFMPSTAAAPDPNSETERLSTLVRTLEANTPGGWLYGGPDYPGYPYPSNTPGPGAVFNQVFRGEKGSLGDMRGKLPWGGHVEETSLGGFPHPGVIVPAASTWGQTALKTGTGNGAGSYGQYMIGNATNVYTIHWNSSPGSDQISACQTVPMNTAPPNSGATYSTTP